MAPLCQLLATMQDLAGRPPFGYAEVHGSGVVVLEGHSGIVAMLCDARDGRQIQCDAVLQSCLGVPSFNFTQLEELLQPHLLVPEPVSLDRQLSASDADTEPQFMDVPVDIPIRRPLHAPRADDDHRGRDLEVLLVARAPVSYTHLTLPTKA